jgi:hypothetical protein
MTGDECVRPAAESRGEDHPSIGREQTRERVGRHECEVRHHDGSGTVDRRECVVDSGRERSVVDSDGDSTVESVGCQYLWLVCSVSECVEYVTEHRSRDCRPFVGVEQVRKASFRVAGVERDENAHPLLELVVVLLLGLSVVERTTDND